MLPRSYFDLGISCVRSSNHLAVPHEHPLPRTADKKKDKKDKKEKKEKKEKKSKKDKKSSSSGSSSD